MLAVGTQPWVNPKVGRHTRLKILMMRDTSVFARSPIFKNPSKSQKSFAPRFTASQSRFPFMFHVILLVTCQHPGLGQGSLNDPFEGGGSNHEKYIEILREFFLKKRLVWGDPRQLFVGTEAALRRAFLLPFLAVSAVSVGLDETWLDGGNIYGRGCKVDLYW